MRRWTIGIPKVLVVKSIVPLSKLLLLHSAQGPKIQPAPDGRWPPFGDGFFPNSLTATKLFEIQAGSLQKCARTFVVARISKFGKDHTQCACSHIIDVFGPEQVQLQLLANRFFAELYAIFGLPKTSANFFHPILILAGHRYAPCCTCAMQDARSHRLGYLAFAPTHHLLDDIFSSRYLCRSGVLEK